MNSNFVYYGWKVETQYALEYIYALGDNKYEDPETWQETEIVPGVFLKYACPVPGLMFQECNFYIVMSKLCSQSTDTVPIDPDDLFEVLRDRELLEEGWRICKNLCCIPDDASPTPPEIYAITHFW